VSGLSERWNMIKGKTIDEANEMLKNLGYFVAEESEQMNYQNVIKVRLVDGVITEFVGVGTWKATKN
jgi:hypothetical protein